MGVSYIPVARVGELAAGEMKEIDLGGRQILLAFAEGKYFAFARQCPHEDADLKNGVLDGAKVRCANHNYCFDPSTRSPALAEGSRSGFRPTGVVEGVTGLPVGLNLHSGECVLPQGGPPLTVLPTEARGEEICIRLEW